MNDGKGYCDHEYEDVTCTCQLEAIIEHQRIRKRVQELFGFDLTTDEAVRQYYSNAYVYSTVNALLLIVEKYDEACRELEWMAQYVLGEELHVNREQAGWRAFNTLKRLGTGDQRRTMYGSDRDKE